MRKELAVISSPEFGEIRSVMVNGEPLFVAKDVCDVLGISNSRDAMNRLDEDIRKCARRFGTSELTIQSVVKGNYVNNDMMADLQQRAIANREKWFDAYGQGRMLEVLGILTGKK